jgi:hypothetical protein
LAFSQSKNEQIESLKIELDSSKNLQLKLVNQIVDLNKIIFSNQENYRKGHENCESSLKQLETKIIVLQNELDSIYNNKSSASNNKSLNGEYVFEESYDGFEDGEGGFVGGGSLIITNFKKTESFYFKIEVARVFGEDYAFTGEIVGEAEFIGDNIAKFYSEDCNLLVFVFDENSVQIIEERCENYHGAGVSFDSHKELNFTTQNKFL